MDFKQAEKQRNDAYIRGYSDAIATLFDQKTAALMYTYNEMLLAGVSTRNIEKIKQWLEAK